MAAIRSLTLPLVAAAMLFNASAVSAAPTCQDRKGETVRCGTVGAMPVGWSLAPDQRPASDDTGSTPWLSLIALVGGLFALIALMPDFDGWGDVEEDGEDPR